MGEHDATSARETKHAIRCVNIEHTLCVVFVAAAAAACANRVFSRLAANQMERQFRDSITHARTYVFYE